MIFCKAKNEEKFKKIVILTLNSVANFWNIQKIGKLLQIFKKKKILGPCDFLKIKTLPRNRNYRFFLIEFLKIYLINRNV